MRFSICRFSREFNSFAPAKNLKNKFARVFFIDFISRTSLGVTQGCPFVRGSGNRLAKGLTSNVRRLLHQNAIFFASNLPLKATLAGLFQVVKERWSQGRQTLDDLPQEPDPKSYDFGYFSNCQRTSVSADRRPLTCAVFVNMNISAGTKSTPAKMSRRSSMTAA